MHEAKESEILSDFLIEAGDLLADLDGQLLALEQDPASAEALNTVFRVFHTIKGGAGFLAVDAMVGLCHRAEDLLNEARAGRTRLTPMHVDALLQAVDRLRGMMAALRADQAPTAAPPELLARLSDPGAASAAAGPAPAGGAGGPLAQHGLDHGRPGSRTHPSDSVEDEFEAMIADLADRPAVAPDAGEAMTDEEFEALLDQIQGGAAAPARPPAASAPETAAASAQDDTAPPPPPERAPAQVDSTIRVETGRLDALVDTIGELVLVRNRMVALAAVKADETLDRAVAELHRVSDELQVAVMRTRMLPIGKLFSRFPRIVRDLARQLGKRVELTLVGEDTDLDRKLVDALADPMVHLARNAVDHGIETPDERIAAGKPGAGMLSLEAAHEGERILIRVRDDGRGMSAAALRDKAVEKGVIDAERAARLSEAECFDLIFLPGFSTRQEVSDVSGRGVGMDVVKTRVSELGGTLSVVSTPGRGSEIVVSLPLTLATLRALMVRIRGRVFALPLHNVVELMDLDPGVVSVVEDSPVIAYRGRALPLWDLRRWAGPGCGDQAGAAQVVVVHVGHRHLGCVVDRVIGREEVVVKPLGAILRTVAGVSGATITGDGRVALVLDVAGLPEAPAAGATAGGSAR